MEEQFISASLIIIGTELSQGIITDKHGQLVASELTSLGYRMDRMVIVPDDGTIGTVIRHCMEETDVILCTGGLGPTSDDMTRQLIAEAAGVPLVRNETAWQEIYARMGERIHGANSRQAMMPAGFDHIPNPLGTAPGFRGMMKLNGRTIACAAMPGPPREMHEMFFTHVLPWLGELRGHTETSRDEYSTFLIPESKLEELCSHHAQEGVQWGTRFEDMKITLYLSGCTEIERNQLITDLEQEVGLGRVVIGNLQPTDLLTRYLDDHNKTISCAESCTSGLFSKLLTDRPGSSAWFWGGVISYDNDAKQRILGVKKETLELYGAVSEACVGEMAEGVLRISETDYAVSISGIAGPEGGSNEKPVGYVCFGFAGRNRITETVALKFSTYGRDSVRRKAASAAAILGTAYVNGLDVLDMAGNWQYI